MKPLNHISLPFICGAFLATNLVSCKTPSDLTAVYKPQWEVKTSVSQDQLPVGVEVTGIEDLPLPKDPKANENAIEKISLASDLPDPGVDPLAPLPGTFASTSPAELEAAATAPSSLPAGLSDMPLPSSAESPEIPTQLPSNESTSVDPLLSSLVDPLAINPPLEPLTPEPVQMPAPEKTEKPAPRLSTKTAANAVTATAPQKQPPFSDKTEIRPAILTGNKTTTAPKFTDADSREEILALAKQIEQATVMPEMNQR